MMYEDMMNEEIFLSKGSALERFRFFRSWKYFIQKKYLAISYLDQRGKKSISFYQKVS